ncbi:MAG: hypothetical protein Q7T55_15560 [Solirubrobacteraceae bacterium]|nr:hypothetical protein [Solirubrobacteraceae bacterium]
MMSVESDSDVTGALRGVEFLSFQIGVLKVLSAHPDGRASVDAIKRDLATLSSREWSAQLRQLAALAPKIDAFSAGLIIRTSEAWQITETGRAFLARLESGETIAAPKEPVLPKPALLVVRPQRPLDQQRPSAAVTGREKLRRSRQQAASLS